MPFTYLNNWNYNKKTTIRNDYLNNVIFVKRMENKLAFVSLFFQSIINHPWLRSVKT